MSGVTIPLAILTLTIDIDKAVDMKRLTRVCIFTKSACSKEYSTTVVHSATKLIQLKPNRGRPALSPSSRMICKSDGGLC